jgi:hypothetical protein
MLGLDAPFTAANAGGCPAGLEFLQNVLHGLVLLLILGHHRRRPAVAEAQSGKFASAMIC